MILAPIPKNEDARLKALYKLKILNTPPEERFDEITRKAVRMFNVPISTVTLIDRDKEWYKSCQGLGGVCCGPRDISFCGHAMMTENVFIVEDTLKDNRFFDNPMVIGAPRIRFYAGMKLYDKTHLYPIGVFCIKDTVPRKLSIKEVADMIELAEEAEREINR